MADLAQLVRALVCGTRCREFESHNPPHTQRAPVWGLFVFCADYFDYSAFATFTALIG